MTVEKPLWAQGLTFPARIDRQLIKGIWPYEGVLNGMSVVQHGAGDFTVDVNIGNCVIFGDDIANQGAYLGQIRDAVKNVTISAAPGSNSRIDLVVARIFDPDAGTGASPILSLESVTGVASGSPVAPAVPASAIKLAEILVTSVTTQILTANITDKRYFAQGATAATTAARDLQPAPAAGYWVYVDSGDANEGPWYYNGTSQRLPWNMPWGLVATATKSTNQTGISYSGTPVDLTGTSVTFTAVANRQYKVSFSTCFVRSSDAEVVVSASDGGQIAVAQGEPGIPGSSGTGYWSLSAFAMKTWTAGSKTVKLQIAGGAGGSTLDCLTGSFPTVLTIEDVGPAGAPT